MDTIANHNWGDVFSDITHQEVFRSSRYAEVVGYFNEPELACARIATIHTPGVEIIRADIHSQRKLVLVDPESVEKISSSFILGGGVESRFSLNKSSVRHWDSTHCFQYTPDFQGEHIIHNQQLHAISVSYDKAYFHSLAESAGMPYLDQVLNCMERSETLLVPPGMLELQPRMAELLHAIELCQFQGLTRYLFLEAKILELFALQIEQLNAGQTNKDPWSIADRERLKAVHEYIIRHHLESLCLADLCLRFGLNEFKLKKGYKYLFGQTVFGHVHTLRMQSARHLLSSGQMNVSEVSFHIGYQTISSFSEAFKKYFGYLPGKIRT
ncbi:helix-turn-helix transcriptional regulator [Telluribacter humicola]|uniref:helix-turn-helix transcriptional regulator n=1 Tax=Telluribacter humicola TaxID=1720261 RepID=UPI001A96611E|nr:helix-turn-helix domain-containing protein [Telluribacter humicola]